MQQPDACGRFILAGVVLLAWLGTAHAGFTVLHAFTDGSDGANPAADLIDDSSGNLYGTTAEGGGSGCNRLGCGTVFKLAPDGTESVLYAFTGGSDGSVPAGVLTKDKGNNLYGTTGQGGGSDCGGRGCGTVFKLAPDGTETILHIFTGGSDGDAPEGGLIKDKTGNFYGTTLEGGGTYAGCNEGCGIVFEITMDGTETVLHAFTGGSDGAFPVSELMRDKAGNLYGTTQEGGGTDCNGIGCGTVFELAPDGTESVLYAFTSGSDGAWPEGGLIGDGAGNLYGTTAEGGGTNCSGLGCGTVFKLAPDGTEVVLHAFTGGSDGAGPVARLTRDKAGNLYGTTLDGGSTGCGGSGCGTVFRIAPDGTESVLYAFRRKSGAYPFAGVIKGDSGVLYGTAFEGGPNCKLCGTVFKFTP